MATVLTPPTPTTPTGTNGSGRNGSGFGGGWGGPEDRGYSVPARTYHTGMWMGLVAIVMLFAAFTSAMVVRKGAAPDWTSIALPRILYLNTGILLASSVALEFSRRSLTAGWADRFKAWLYVTTFLGVAFIGGQLLAWRELASRGVYLATNPSSSFFYVLTAAHGVHLLGGIIALFYIVSRSPQLAAGIKRRVAVDVTALYWHFMDGLWIYLLILLTVRL
ncbi:MAG: cytochrome c oxidase subunit 3 [Terriglobia bacterium]|jgi:cytochrome c oxidase subunit 3